MKSFTLKFALLFLLGVGLASTAAAQKIGGVVKDSAGKPVIGASVIVDGTTLGASSGVDGQWTLNVPDASKKTLVISYIGMKTQRIAIGSKTQIDVRLEDESTAMDDVVVVGYATEQQPVSEIVPSGFSFTKQSANFSYSRRASPPSSAGR